MFDRTFVLPARAERVTHTSHKHVSVHEHRAPTDESVKIFREMVEAARREVVDSIKVADTSFECVVHAERDSASGDVVLAAIFSLSGKKQRVESRTREDATLQERYDGLVKAVSGHIAEQAVRPALAALLRERVSA